MKRRDPAKYLWDAADACEALIEYTASRSLSEYRDDRFVQAAVDKHIEIIAEAVRQAAEQEPPLRSKITHYSELMGLRNRLVHTYFDIDRGVVWDTIREDLPPLLRELRALIPPPPC